MLMKPTPDHVELGPNFCGFKKLFFGPTGVFSVSCPCKRWYCPDCQKMMTRRIIRGLHRLFKEKRLSTIYIADFKKTSEELSRWVNNYIKGWFFRVLKAAETYLLISNKAFNGAQRIGTGKALKLIKAELMKDGPYKGRHRCSKSRELEKYFREIKTKTNNFAWVNVEKIGEEKAKALEKEFISLETNVEIANFLQREAYENVLELTNTGKELLRQHGVTEDGITFIDEESELVFINFETNNNVNIRRGL